MAVQMDGINESISPSRICLSGKFIFKNYWRIALLGASLGIGLVETFTTGERTSLIGSIIAAALGFCYFAQQQKLAEISLFKELFTEFNKRYDDLNERLREIATSGDLPDETA